MNVLQVNKLYYPEVGGVERVVQNIAEGLPETHTTEVLAASPSGFGEQICVNGVEVTRVSSLRTVSSVPLAPTFPVHLRARRQNADIVHHHLPNPLSAVSQLVAGHDETPVVVTYHSDIVRQAGALRAYRPILDRFLEGVDRILVTSARLRDQSIILEPYRDKCEIVPLSVDIDAIDSEVAPPLEIDTAGPVILFAGRLNYYKGVRYLIEAMNGVEATLLIAGDGPRRAELETLVRRQGLSDCVQFLGYVSDQRLSRAYRTADLFILPSTKPSEAFGIVQLEAMARQLPVINTALPTGVPWVSVDGETGLTVPPCDSTALTAAINELLGDDSRRRRFGRQARERVERLFTRERMIGNIRRVYQDTVTQANSRT